MQVEEDIFGRGLMAGGHLIEPLDGIGFVAGAEFIEEIGGVRKLREKIGGDFGADFVAAGADGRTDGGEEIFRFAAKMHAHVADGFGGDAAQGTAPAGVDGGDGTFFGIDQQNRDAVGGLDCEQQARTIGDGSVGVDGFHWVGVELADQIGVELF